MTRWRGRGVGVGAVLWDEVFLRGGMLAVWRGRWRGGFWAGEFVVFCRALRLCTRMRMYGAVGSLLTSPAQLLRS